MSGKVAFDQSEIDKLVADAESDTIESRVAHLEEEVTEIKGSIKALLMDLRETMNVLENPFQDIQGIANISGALINSNVKSLDKDDVEDNPPEEANKQKEKAKERESDNIGMGSGEPNYKNSFEDLNQVAKNLPIPVNAKLIDPISFYKTIVWSKDMVEKYDHETITKLAEVFYKLGYISSDIKEVIIRTTEMLDQSNDLDSAVMDLYRLYHIINPEDPSLDSKVLDYVLNENNTVKNLWQRK
jgi:hypothetical protein